MRRESLKEKIAPEDLIAPVCVFLDAVHLVRNVKAWSFGAIDYYGEGYAILVFTVRSA